MRANRVVITGVGGPEVLKVEEFDPPPPLGDLQMVVFGRMIGEALPAAQGSEPGAPA